MYCCLLPFLCFSQKESGKFVIQKSENSSDTTWLFRDPSVYVKKELANPQNKDYIKVLESSFLKILHKDTLTYDELLNVIPKTETEYLIYFECDYEEGVVNKIWNQLDQIISDKAKKNKDIFSLYLNLTEFVDGYYAETYFENLEFIISEYYKSFFCCTYFHLNEKCQRRLIEYHKNFCDQNMKIKN